MSSFRELNVYIEARNLVVRVYALLKKFPEEERFAMCSQLRRSSVSVTSNIAEGISRTSSKDQVHFLNIAFGSLMETDCQFEIARDLNYISSEEYDLMYQKIHTLAKIITGLKSRRLSISVASINH